MTKLNYNDLEKRTGVFNEYTEVHGWTHHDAMPNWYDVCPQCGNPHWAWFKKGENIEFDAEIDENYLRRKSIKIGFTAETDGKLCLRCGKKWTKKHKDRYIRTSGERAK